MSGTSSYTTVRRKEVGLYTTNEVLNTTQKQKLRKVTLNDRLYYNT